MKSLFCILNHLFHQMHHSAYPNPPLLHIPPTFHLFHQGLHRHRKKHDCYFWFDFYLFYPFSPLLLPLKFTIFLLILFSWIWRFQMPWYAPFTFEIRCELSNYQDPMLIRPGKSCKPCKWRLQTFCQKSYYFEDILSQIFHTFDWGWRKKSWRWRIEVE